MLTWTLLNGLLFFGGWPTHSVCLLSWARKLEDVADVSGGHFCRKYAPEEAILGWWATVGFD